MTAITPDSQVTLHFEIRLEDGSVVDSNFGGDSATFSMGDGSLLEGFEKCLLGLVVGDRKTFNLPCSDAFGPVNEDNQLYFKKERFKDMELQEGLILEFEDAANTSRLGVVAIIEDERILVDFNHPLAGKDLAFEVEITAIASVGDA